MRTDHVVLRTLGTARIDIGAVRIRPSAVRRFAALLYLSAEAGRRVPRRYLVDLLFPDRTERTGAHSLRELTYRLKAAGLALESDQEGIELPAPWVTTDYGEVIGSERLALEQIRAAQGGFLPGYTPLESEAYREWYEPFRAKTCSALSRVLLRDQGRARDVANLELAEAAARACLAISPLHEHGVKALAETLALSGAKADAISLLAGYAAEMGSRSHQLEISADLLRRRITERLPDQYTSSADLPFGGRDDEMLEIGDRFKTSKQGLAQCVLLLGEPGIGKTRIISEFGAVARMQGTNLARFAAQPNDRARPMSAFVDLVPSLLRMRGAIGIAPASMEALGRLIRSDSVLTGSPPTDPELVSRAITCAIDDLVSAIAGEGHLTIVIEDAHWVDPLSLRALRAIVQTRRRCVFVVMTSRERRLDGFTAPLPDELVCIELQPLKPDISQDIARRALRGTLGEGHAALHAWMAETANGHPLFIASLVAHFAATAEPFVVPPSLQELIKRRLDRLEPASLLVLQTCVLLGSLSTLTRLVKCLNIPYADLVLAVAQLERSHALKFVEGNPIPAHVLLADAVVQRTADGVKALLHMQLANVLEAELSTIESPAVLWSCAEHWVEAGDHQRAFRLLRRCADHAREMGRAGSAAEILLRSASMQVDTDGRVDALKEAVRLAQVAHEHDLVLHGAEQLRHLAPLAHFDDVELAELHALSVTHRDPLGYEQRVLAYLESSATRPEQRVRAGLAALQYADNSDRVDVATRAARAITRCDLDAVDQLLALQYRLVYEIAFGDAAEGARIARQLQALAKDIPGTVGAGLQFNSMIALLRTGAADEALTACLDVYERCLQCGALKLQLAAALQISILLVDRGCLDESVHWRNRTQSLVQENDQLLDAFETYVHEIDFCILEGNLARAQELFRRCEELQLFSSPMRRRWHQALGARLKQLSDAHALSDEELLDLVRRGNESIPTTGIRDLEVAVICAGFCQNGDRIAAQEAFRVFLACRSRLAQLPVAPHLRQVIAQYELSPT